MDISAIGSSFLPGSSAAMLDLDSSINIRYHHQPSAVPRPHILPIHAASASDDDDDDSAAADDNVHGSAATFSMDEKPKQSSPWHRMKWTDEMVHLLVAVVAFINDEGTPDPAEAAARRRSGAALQKKGKWKAVSNLMLEKGCYVSPQQCEDKFNDLNKRYKRLNEILGRGTTCMVVENPMLLDSMTHVSPKMKDDVKKILNSKHLFYREMCAYHNGQKILDSQNFELRSENIPNSGSLHDGNEDDEGGDDDDDGKGDDIGNMSFDYFHAEIDLVLQDKTKTSLEKLDWFQRQAFQLKQEKLAIQAEALELEKRSFKWQRFRCKKDREIEKIRMENERLMMANERIILELSLKELELDPRRLRAWEHGS